MESSTIRVVDIVAGTSVDGPGLRTSVYIAGCCHQCPGCHNPQTWDFDYGHLMTVQQIMSVIEDNGFNVTLTGGDPLYSIDAITPLVKVVAAAGYNIWLYTGYRWEELLLIPGIYGVLDHVAAVVDGPFEAGKRDLSLCFRGSSNQRIIDVPASLSAGHAVTLDY
ncbi:MAG: anaerobic ribonucleoside-triphosphate reductase activating protein [Muribaculaceae bacterium]|nr:anaerobic ribonucleoside-triphosphate reductase activating protein [Muribaculaceae bacterium]